MPLLTSPLTYAPTASPVLLMRRSTRYGKKLYLRRRRRAPKALSKRQTKVVKRIAVNQQMKHVETKRFCVLNEGWSFAPANVFSFQYAYVNVFSALGNNTGQSGFVGDSIERAFLEVRLQTFMNFDRNRLTNSSGAGFMPLAVHLWVIATNDQLPATTPTQWEVNTSSPWFLQPYGEQAKFNGSNVRVLKHRMLTWHNTVPISGTTYFGYTAKNLKMKVRFKGKKVYEEAQTGTTNVPNPALSLSLKGWNYYIVCGYTFPYGVNVNMTPGYAPVSITMDRYLYFKDP